MKIDKNIANAHWEKMKQLYEKNVRKETNPQKAQYNFRRLVDKEMDWLKEHEGYPRFFSPLNSLINPIKIVECK